MGEFYDVMNVEVEVSVCGFLGGRERLRLEGENFVESIIIFKVHV